MEIVNWLLLFILILFLVNRMMPVQGVRQITTIELKKKLKDQKIQFVDVRTPHEFKSNHIKGFQNIPLYELTERIGELSKEKEIILICQSGMRSNKASKILKKHGFPHVTNVKGGMNAW